MYKYEDGTERGSSLGASTSRRIRPERTLAVAGAAIGHMLLLVLPLMGIPMKRERRIIEMYVIFCRIC